MARVSSIASAIEPYDKVWGVGASGFVTDPSPFERINLILDDTERTTNGEVFPERCVIMTRVMKEMSGYPQIIKNAEAMAAVLRETPIQIYDHELIVGSLGCPKKGAPVFPEFGLNWLLDEMENGLLDYSETRTHDYFHHTEETYRQLKECEPFWVGNCVEDRLTPNLTEAEIAGSHMNHGIFFCDSYLTCGAGHLGVNYDRLLMMGYGAIKAEIEEKMAALDLSNPEDIKKNIFYRAALIMNQAATDFILRHAEAARKKAAETTDETRKKELIKIAENCEWISVNAPRTFYEAIQAVQLANNMVLMESNGHSISYGRFDQYMLPFYKRDLETGEATREFCQELIENFHIKIWEMNKVRNHIAIDVFANGGIGGPALTVGGVLEDGKDGTNDLTFMVLDAVAHTRIPTPWTAVRLHAGTPEELKVKTANLIRLGLGEPKIFNDDVTVPMMVANGRSIEDARNYQVVGCVEPDTTGKEYGWHDAAYFNINKVLELALNGGRDMETGEQYGPDYGSLETFTSFEEVKEAYEKQMAFWVDTMIGMLSKIDLIHQDLKPLPFLSNLMDGPIEEGVDVTAGGAIYNFAGPQGVGVASVADALSTIKQLVFEEKKVSGKELLEAARDNWEGHEKLYALVNSDYVHHYGNDDDYADELACFAFDTYCNAVNGHPTAHGGHFQAGFYSVAVNVALGGKQWASVEGRKAFEPVSDCMGAQHTLCCPHDVKGPSAICKSVTKIDHGKAGNGTLLNWKFSPAALEGDTGLDNLISLLDTYVQRKGMHSQFTVASKETLLDAQEHPSEYKDLLVRVAGYSAYFVELSKQLQDDIIGRTELNFG
ncbi:MAG: formate C-acetyltransferase/glycerol dehydratase family glycyl radical enzyme [Eubacterium sp.]|nr:formate C-acetyltransferase/glycerol dehydratase family glycyl radical enzyme [Eubacterium sp.]